MKNIFIAFALLIATSTLQVKADKLVDAIKAGNRACVEQLLAQHRTLEPNYKKELTEVAHKATKHAKKATEHLLKSNLDALRLIGGISFSAGGAFLVRNGLSIWRNGSLSIDNLLTGTAFIGFGSVIALVSAQEAYKGWKMSFAHSRLEKATAIELLVAEKEIRHHK